MKELEQAWAWREKNPLLAHAQALRWFHGPAEGRGETQSLMIEVFGGHAWVFERESDTGVPLSLRGQVAEFLQFKKIKSGVWLARPEKGVPSEALPFFGEPPREGLVIEENGSRFEIRFQGTRHPGLFLDHEPLRTRLREKVHGLRVLNTFCYTGSLSVACALGGAKQVVSLDLSKPTLDWAKRNWALNDLPEDRAEWFVGDYFDKLPFFAKRGRRFDVVILDPPSFSRGTKGTFSTQKDLVRLHETALAVLEPGGLLVTSINSAQIPDESFQKQIREALKACARSGKFLESLGQPETFPVRANHPEDRYLKGWIIQS